MKAILIISLLLASGCAAAVRVDEKADAITDKAIDILIKEHNAVHSKIEQGIIWLEKERIEDLIRLNRLKEGLEH